MPILTSLVASLALAPQVGDVTTVRFLDLDSLTATTGSCAYDVSTGGLGGGVHGGWIATGRNLFSACTAAQDFVLFGRLAGDSPDTVRVLREPRSLLGFTQTSIGTSGRPMLGSSIAYAATLTGTPNHPTSLWIDDQLLAVRNDPIPGIARQWNSFSTLYRTSSGGLLVYGLGTGTTVDEPNGRVLFDWTTQQVLLAERSMHPTLPSTIRRVLQDPDVSLNGAHWGAIVRLDGDPDEAVLVDGALYDFGGGFLALEREPVPPLVDAVLPGAMWSTFRGVQVTDEGDVVVRATARANSSFVNVLWRNDAIVTIGLGESEHLVDVDPRGAILTRRPGDVSLKAEGVPVHATSLGVDFDRDGAVDSGWTVDGVPLSFLQLPLDGETTYFSELQDPNSNASPDAILTMRGHRLDERSCDPFPNSTGRGGEILVTGDRRAASNEVELRAYFLPRQSFGYFLASTTPDYVPNPAGSSGALCLGGEIGRLADQIFSTGSGDRGGATLDLTAVPQPTGSVAAVAGETWYFQAWHRDVAGGAPTSNFTAAGRVVLE